MIIFILSTYIFLEYQNYINYQIKKQTLNCYKVKHSFDHNQIQERIKILIDDIKNDHVDATMFVNGLFGESVSINQISKSELYEGIYDNLYPGVSKELHEQNNDGINSIINTIEEKLNINFIDRKEIINGYMSIGNDPIVIWYKPLFFTIGLRLLKIPSELYLKNVLNFKKTKLTDNIIIWSKINDHSDTSIIFIPSCIGGITFYPNFFRRLQLNKSYSIIIPEIPEMSWNKSDEIIPPNLSIISYEISNFIKNTNTKNLNIIGHSFGTIVMNHIINEHYELFKQNQINIKKLIYIEGLLFYSSVFKTLKTIENSFYDVLFGTHMEDIFTMPLFQRDMYVKYYIKRCLNIAHSVLSGTGLTECEKYCDIHAVMSSNDNKFVTDEYVKYIEKKNLPIKYRIFNDCTHGSFVWNNEFQEHVLNLL